MPEFDVDVAILGAGTAGLAAYREALNHTDRIALVDGGTLGTTCALVGCMPSKLLIAAADACHRTGLTEQFGIRTGAAQVDGKAVMRRVHEERDRFVGFVCEAIAGFDQQHIVRQNARFADDTTLVLTDGTRLTARSVVIATGSRPSIPKLFEVAGDRLITSDEVFDWQDLPRSIAVFGAGVIGLELGQALHRLGVETQLFGRGHSVGPLSDPDVRGYAARCLAADFPAFWHVDTDIRREGEQVIVAWEGEETGEARFEWLLAATGRRANVDSLGLDATSLALDARGVPEYDRLSMRAGQSNIFVAGDATVDVPLLHEAADEGRLAGENAARLPDVFRRARRTSLGIVFSDPQIAMAGESHRELTERGARFASGEVTFENQGRARVMAVNKGLLKVYGEADTGRLLGAEMIGPDAEHLAHLIAWSIQGNLTVTETLERPFYHPVIEEGLRTALRGLNHALGFGASPPASCIDCGPGG